MSRFNAAIVGILALVAAACASERSPVITVELPFTGGDWFQLRVCEGGVEIDDEGARSCVGRELFDSGCAEQLETTFVLSGIETGAERTLLYEAYTAADCDPEFEIAFGFRGNVTVESGGEPPYYCIPVYVSGQVTTLPSNLSVSMGLAEEVPFCTNADDNAECTDLLGVPGVCEKQTAADFSKENFYCIPSCQEDAQCEEFHPSASCDVTINKCVIAHPYPLNMSSPRVFGSSVVTGDGSILMIGGFDRLQNLDDGSQRLMAGRFLERFSANTGLFSSSGIESGDAGPLVRRGFAGVASLSPDLHVAAGGYRSVALTTTGGISVTSVVGLMCSTSDPEAACETNNISDDVDALDTANGTRVSGKLPAATGSPSVVAMDSDSFLVVGGWVNDGGDLEGAAVRSDQLVYCTVGDEEVSCVLLTESLDTPRAEAAARCTSRSEDNGVCSQVLVLGGNEGAPSAELLSVAGAAVVVAPLGTSGLGSEMAWPTFCGDHLISGAPPALTEVDAAAGMLTLTPVVNEENVAIETYFASSAEAADGSCWLLAGAAPGGTDARDSCHRITAAGVSPQSYTLARPRIGASAAIVSHGPLQGVVLVTGGLTVDSATQELQLVSGAEVLRP